MCVWEPISQFTQTVYTCTHTSVHTPKSCFRKVELGVKSTILEPSALYSHVHLKIVLGASGPFSCVYIASQRPLFNLDLCSRGGMWCYRQNILCWLQTESLDCTAYFHSKCVATLLMWSCRLKLNVNKRSCGATTICFLLKFNKPNCLIRIIWIATFLNFQPWRIWCLNRVEMTDQDLLESNFVRYEKDSIY